MTPGELSSAIVAAARGAIAAGDLPALDLIAAAPASDAIQLRAAHSGDGYATPFALRLAAVVGRPAPEVAALLAKRLARVSGIRTASVTGPGILTVSLRTPGVLAAAIVEAGERYAHAAIPPPTRPVWPRHPLTFDNPGFLVRFAHARAAGTVRQAADLEVSRAKAPHEALGATSPTPAGPISLDPARLDPTSLDPRLLDASPERTLLTLLGELPRWAEQAAVGRGAPDPLVYARHLERVADAYHHVHEHCPALPKGDEEPTSRHHARLWLAAAVQLALAGGLRTLGEIPPERL